MSEVEFLVATGGLWVAIGIVLSIVMGRRGHNSFGWLVLGVLLGPFAVVLAVDARRHDERLEPERVQGGAPTGRGPVDVVVGYDGSPESFAAMHGVVELLGDRLGRLTVTTVVPYDGVKENSRRAGEALLRLAARSPVRVRDLEVLHGPPAAALGEYATAGGYDLIAVGTRGAGVTKAILGSAASELARDSKVPVLVVGANVRQGEGASRLA